jgi:hypothetical protein
MTPADIVNQSLDSIAVENTIGDLNEGTTEARAALRWYMPTLLQLLRTAHWNYARKSCPLTLLNDATGQTAKNQATAGLPVTVGNGTPGMVPWIYEYDWPVDCIKARFVPWNGCQPTTTPPQTTASSVGSLPYVRQIPARFLVGQDSIPDQVGLAQSWAQVPDYADALGHAPNQRTVILTNVPNAALVYTALIIYPAQWDVLFRQAFVATLASYLALPCQPDKKLALTLRAQQMEIAKAAIMQARISDGDEGWTTTDHTPDWLRVRSAGPRWGAWGGPGDAGLGVLGYGFDSMGFGDGSAY